MSTISTILVTPSTAVDAYQRTSQSAPRGSGSSFGATMEEVLSQAEAQGHNADNQAMKAVSGTGNITEVVTALSQAELTLQTVTAIRDRVVQAYQDIMKMPI